MVALGHRDFRQCLRVHRLVLTDDAVEPQEIGGDGIEIVIAQRFGS